ncbi:hypothetical protein RHECNPAF_9300100 [Rhizobium etli CNPAF512]|nr:hypothetical protein RHECNPAF_9300100 [Rhizobium etli CNPAF512]
MHRDAAEGFGQFVADRLQDRTGIVPNGEKHLDQIAHEAPRKGSCGAMLRTCELPLQVSLLLPVDGAKIVSYGRDFIVGCIDRRAGSVGIAASRAIDGFVLGSVADSVRNFRHWMSSISETNFIGSKEFRQSWSSDAGREFGEAETMRWGRSPRRRSSLPFHCRDQESARKSGDAPKVTTIYSMKSRTRCGKGPPPT